MHPSPEAMIDFVEQKLGAEGRRGVEAHLRQGCRRCQRRLEEYRIIANSLHDGPLEEPPTELVNAAIRLFDQFTPATSRITGAVRAGVRVARLVFDSARPDLFAPLAVRGRVSGRRLRFEDDRFELDLLLAPVPAGVQLTAQALSMGSEVEPIESIRFCIQQGDVVILDGECGQFGEFEALVEEATDLQIVLGDSTGRVRFDIPE